MFSGRSVYFVKPQFLLCITSNHNYFKLQLVSLDEGLLRYSDHLHYVADSLTCVCRSPQCLPVALHCPYIHGLQLLFRPSFWSCWTKFYRVTVSPLSLSPLAPLTLYGYQPPNPIRISLQGTGWSALHFSAERGDWDTTRGLLEAGASPHLKDKVCDVADHLPSSPECLLYCCISPSITVVSLSPLLLYLSLSTPCKEWTDCYGDC